VILPYAGRICLGPARNVDALRRLGRALSGIPTFIELISAS
jgi:hypothetical protein